MDVAGKAWPKKLVVVVWATLLRAGLETPAELEAAGAEPVGLLWLAEKLPRTEGRTSGCGCPALELAP